MNTFIHDNRDGTREAVRVPRDAVPNAFETATQTCRQRNRREGWMRFVPLRVPVDAVRVKTKAERDAEHSARQWGHIPSGEQS